MVKITVYYAPGFCGSGTGTRAAATAGLLPQPEDSKPGLRSSNDLFTWLVWITLGRAVSGGWIAGAIWASLSLCFCGFPILCLQHCHFQVAGLSTRWFRAPKMHSTARDREMWAGGRGRAHQEKTMSFVWSGFRTHVAPLSPPRLKGRENRFYLLMGSRSFWKSVWHWKYCNGHFWKVQSATVPSV